MTNETPAGFGLEASGPAAANPDLPQVDIEVSTNKADPVSLVDLCHRVGVDVTINGPGYDGDGRQCFTLRFASYDAMVRFGDIVEAHSRHLSAQVVRERRGEPGALMRDLTFFLDIRRVSFGDDWQPIEPGQFRHLPYRLGLRDAAGVYGWMIPVRQMPRLVDMLEWYAPEDCFEFRDTWRALWRKPYPWWHRLSGVVVAACWLVLVPFNVGMFAWERLPAESPVVRGLGAVYCAVIAHAVGRQVWPWAARLRVERFGGES